MSLFDRFVVASFRGRLRGTPSEGGRVGLLVRLSPGIALAIAWPMVLAIVFGEVLNVLEQLHVRGKIWAAFSFEVAGIVVVLAWMILYVLTGRKSGRPAFSGPIELKEGEVSAFSGLWALIGAGELLSSAAVGVLLVSPQSPLIFSWSHVASLGWIMVFLVVFLGLKALISQRVVTVLNRKIAELANTSWATDVDRDADDAGRW